jgi:iron(III) transport system ATP-binding protein
MSLLCLKQLTKCYPSQPFPAVDRLSVDLEKGEILALLGPSGCGKTTTLRLIAGFERPDTGVVEIGGKVMADGQMSVPPEGRGVGVVFQEYTLFPHLTVAENILFGLRKLGVRERTQRLQETLKLVGLEAFGGRYPHELSGGQQQRVALARALAPRPAVLLLDEPFSNLDADLRTQLLHEVYTILRGLETTAVFVTHDHEEAFMWPIGWESSTADAWNSSAAPKRSITSQRHASWPASSAKRTSSQAWWSGPGSRLILALSRIPSTSQRGLPRR